MSIENIIFIEKAYMTSIYEMTDISRLPQEAFQHFLNYEDEILYILSKDEMLGVFSIGDLERFYNEESQQIKINSQYIFIDRVDYKMAEKYFERLLTINELPVVTKNKKLIGIMRRSKENALRKKQRFSLRNARINCWHRNEIERFIKQTKAKVVLYTHSNILTESRWSDDDDIVQILKKRQTNNNASDWKGLSEAEWVEFWQSEYEEGLVSKMKIETEGCIYTLKNGVGTFQDREGYCYSYEGGFRVTRNNPPTADRGIFFYGPCTVFGLYCKDNQTIEYYLQDYLNRNGYLEWKVINRGICGPENCYNQMFLERLSENDIVMIWCMPGWLPNKRMDQLILCRDITEVFLKIPSLINYIVDSPIHCNYIVNQKIAEEIFEDFCKIGILNGTKQLRLPERIQDYYINWDVHEYFSEYFERYKLYKESDDIVVGAIVMNCNPFTKGHRYLIEKATEKVDKLYIFVVEEDKSYFKFLDRFKMVEKGVSDLVNVCVIPSGKYMISNDTFAQYFKKEQVQIIESMDYDIHIFGEIVAEELGIRYRFVGEELVDRVTCEYNETMKRILPEYGVTVIEIPRCTFDISEDEEEIISASLVRSALQRNDVRMLEKLCPASTLKYIESMEEK